MTPNATPTDPAREGIPLPWRSALVAFGASLAFLLIAYGRTMGSLVNVWRHSDTFAHGFFVGPVCLYLAWRNRESLGQTPPRPFPLALLLLLPLGAAWLVGRASSTLLVEQFAFVAMVPVLALSCFGPKATRRLAFPLGFLFFAVPFGDVFTPKLMTITADLAERLLRWSGVAIAREGLYLTTTTTRWRVVESCSGLRFTIASVVLATLFAYFSFGSIWKRLTFVASAVVVSILANGLRAYALILIGHMTDLRLGSGLDHYAYGWLVFTIAMMVFFWVGASFRDRAAPEEGGEPDRAAAPKPPRPDGGATRRRWAVTAAIAAVLGGAWPGLDALGAGDRTGAARGAPVALAPPSPRGGWTLEPEDASMWHPFFHGAAAEINRRYAARDGSVQCFIAYYAGQSQGHELLYVGNTLLDEDDPNWRVVRSAERRIEGGGSSFTVRETVLRVKPTTWVVWQWYWVPDEDTTDPIYVKWLQAKARLLGRRADAAVVVLAAASADSRDSEQLLSRFREEMHPSIRRSLRGALATP